MNKQKWIIVLGIVVGLTLFVYIQSLEDASVSTEDEENPSYVNEVDEEGLLRALEEIAPGITKARELGSTNLFNNEWSIENSDETLRIEEVWMREEDPSVVFYSVGLHGEVTAIHDLPKLTSRIQIDDMEEDYFTELLRDDRFDLDNLYKDGRYYSVSIFYLPSKSTEIAVAPIHQIELTHTTVHKQGYAHQVEPIQLDVEYNP